MRSLSPVWRMFWTFITSLVTPGGRWFVWMNSRVQLIRETRHPLPAQPGQPERVDYEYERNGTAAIFLFTEPLGNWRRVSVREHRTAVDWAEEIRRLLEEDYPQAEKVILICDQLNTHTVGALYQAFPPEKARALAMRLEIHYTPKHGSWLNVAEIELSVFTRQCLDRRIPDAETLRQEASGLVSGTQRPSERRGLAIHDSECPDSAETPVPTNQNLTNQ